MYRIFFYHYDLVFTVILTRTGKKNKKLFGPERQFSIRPFLFDNLLFDGATRSPLCARAGPFSKQFPPNDTQMVKEFVAAAPLRSVSPSELFAPRHFPKNDQSESLRRLGTPGHRVNQEFGPSRNGEGAV